MGSIDKENIMKTFPEPSQFKQKVQTLQSQLPSILEDFKKYFVFYNKNPEYPEYQQMFQNIRGHLTNLNSQLFSIANDIDLNTDNLNNKLLELDNLIKEEKSNNNELKLKLGIVDHKKNAANELITDYKNIYDYEYLRNWGLFFSIFVAIVSISKVYKNNTV